MTPQNNEGEHQDNIGESPPGNGSGPLPGATSSDGTNRHNDENASVIIPDAATIAKPTPAISWGWAMKTGTARGILTPGDGALTAWTARAVAKVLSKLRGDRDSWFSPHLWRDNARNGEAWLAASGVVLDLDWVDSDGKAKSHAPLPPEIRARMNWLARERQLPGNLAYPTPRGFRLMFMFTSPVADKDVFKRAVTGAIARTRTALREADVLLAGDAGAGFDFDKAAYDLARVFRAPNCKVPGEPEPRRANVVVVLDELYDSDELAANAPNDPTPDTSNITGFGVDVEPPTLPPPVDMLPAPLGDYIQAIATSYSVPLELPFVLALGVVSGCIGRAVDIRLKHDQIEPVPLWLAVIAGAGSTKSPILKRLLKRVVEYDDELGARHTVAVEEWERLRDAYEAAKKKKQSHPLPEPPGDRPRREQITVSDVTIEALADVLQVSPRVIAAHDELAAMFDAMGAYKARGGHDRQSWLSLHNGGRIVVNRKGKDPLIVPNPRIAVVGCTTPEAFRRLIWDADGIGTGDGMLDRFFFVQADYGRPKYDVPHVPEHLEAEHGKRIHALLILPLAADGEPPRLLMLSHEAKAIYAPWYESQIAANAHESVRGLIGKLAGHAGRIAATLTLYENANALEVNGPMMQAAIAIAEWLAAHSTELRLTVAPERTGSTSIDDRVLALIRRRGGVVTPRDVQQATLPGLRTADDVRRVLTRLQEAGYGTLKTTTTPAGRETEVFSLFDTQPTNTKDQ